MNGTPDGKMPGESRSTPRRFWAESPEHTSPGHSELCERRPGYAGQKTAKALKGPGDRVRPPSAQIRARVVAARQKQQARFVPKPKITCNARMGSRELKQHCALDEATLDLLKLAMTDKGLSARAYDRILKVARTIADLAGSDSITSDHVSEAIQYRSLDRQIWT